MTDHSDKAIAANDPKLADARPRASAARLASTKPIAAAAFLVAPLNVSEVASVSGSDVHELKAWAAACFQRKEVSIAKQLSEAAARLEAAEEQAKTISGVLHGDTKISVLVEALKKQPIDNALVLLALMRIERNRKASPLEGEFAKQRSQIASMGARGRIKKDSKGTQKAKTLVYGLWKEWKSHVDPSSKYKNTSDFAKNMWEKWPDELSNVGTVKNWCTQWARGENTPTESSSS